MRCRDLDGVVGGEYLISEVIIVAIITGFCSVLGQWLISREREARLDERLKSVEHKLDEHNRYADKIGGIQTDIASIKTDIRNIKERT